MKKVLLLSCSTGQGHNSCAKAIDEYFSLQDVDCNTRDALDFISKGFARFISWGHSFIYRNLPGLFKWGYKYSEKNTSVFDSGSLVHKLFISGSKKLRQYIADEEYDTVICTHLFAAVMISHIQSKDPLPIKTAFVATDYTYYPGLDFAYLEKNFIFGKEQIVANNKVAIPNDQIISCQIPVRLKFFNKIEKDEAKRQLDIDSRSVHLLIMSGSMGCGPIKKILSSVAKEMPEDAKITVIAGTNKSLYGQLKRKYGKDFKINIVAYTDQIDLYMSSADLYLTKPGGISVTEAALKSLPMIFVNAVAGCEQYNMDYFLNMGAAVTGASVKEIAAKSIHLLGSADERKRMSEKIGSFQEEKGAETIYRHMK